MLIKRVLCSILISILLILSLILVTGLLTGGSRLNAIDLKEARARQLRGKQKLLVVGGSASDYGINSELLEQSIGIPVVNFGLQGSLGLAFMLSEARANSEHGDVILLHLESELFSRVPIEGESTVMQLISRSPGTIRYVKQANFERMPLYLAETLRSNITAVILSFAYRITGKKANADLRNVQGDYIGHEGKAAAYTSKPFVCVPTNVNAIYLLSQFVDDCKLRNITVLLAFAPIDQATIPHNCKQSLEEDVRGIKGLRVISSYDEAKLASEYFFDTSHHLRFEKRDFWTQSLIERLKKVI